MKRLCLLVGLLCCPVLAQAQAAPQKLTVVLQKLDDTHGLHVIYNPDDLANKDGSEVLVSGTLQELPPVQRLQAVAAVAGLELQAVDSNTFVLRRPQEIVKLLQQQEKRLKTLEEQLPELHRKIVDLQTGARRHSNVIADLNRQLDSIDAELALLQVSRGLR